MSRPEPYYTDDAVELYCGDFRDILPELGIVPDLTVCDHVSGLTGAVQ